MTSNRVQNGCFHCGLPLPPKDDFSAEIAGEKRPFCCIGCREVCRSIYAAGLEGFYQRTPEGSLLAPPPEIPQELALYDLDEVQEEFIVEHGDVREINLLVVGIHCAACVWLIERSLAAVPGIVSASVNLSGRRLLVRWDNSRLQLSTILRSLGEIGYAAVPFDPEAAEGALKKQNRAFLFRLAFAAFAMMNMMWISIALYTGADQGEFRNLFHWLGFILATPTLFYSGGLFFKGAWTGLRTKHLTMDLPIVVGASITYMYSFYITVTQSTTGEVYWDTVVNFMFVILIGRHLESISKRRAVSATQRLLDLQPRGAVVLRDGEEQLMPIRAVKSADIVLVKAGDRIPVDGAVVEGFSAVDEAMLSGESRPVNKKPGDKVSAGTVNLNSALTLKVSATLKQTALGRIIQLVEEAQASKAPIQCTADRIVPWFVVVTLLLGALTFIYWSFSDIEIALLAACSVMIITCPCAFGMATPMSIAVASGLAARHGILIKNGAVLETLSGITHFVFDKTGSLTEGRMAVQNIHAVADIDANVLLLNAAAVERYSEHPVARAIVAAARKRELEPASPAMTDFCSTAGLGVSGNVARMNVLLGNENWLRQNNIFIPTTLQTTIEDLEQRGVTCIHAALNKQYAGFISITDQLRPDARILVNKLRAQGIRMTLLSGDRRRVAESVAEQLGGMDVIAEVLPEDKDRVIAELQHQGEQVAMVGDGINDAPALIRANVGIAIGSGTEVSAESADIVLISNELEKIDLATRLSRRTLRTIRQNIAMSLSYNAVTVPLAMAALVTPLFAAIAMPISSLLVIGNAARIRTLFADRRELGEQK
ncbi:MAG: heavy metal translocating P-type ATPase [Thiohalomonadaceae bacterium]